MILIAKLLIFGAFIAGSIGVTRAYLSERPLLIESGIDDQRRLAAVILTWLCAWVPLAAFLPSAGAFLLNPLPLGALLAIPAAIVLKGIKQTLERRGTDRTRRAEGATDRALLIAYASAALTVADWGLSLAVRSLPNITGGQL